MLPRTDGVGGEGVSELLGAGDERRVGARNSRQCVGEHPQPLRRETRPAVDCGKEPESRCCCQCCGFHNDQLAVAALIRQSLQPADLKPKLADRRLLMMMSERNEQLGLEVPAAVVKTLKTIE